MSRFVRRFSWKLLGFALAIAILSLLAPTAWRHLAEELEKGRAPRDVAFAVPSSVSPSSVFTSDGSLPDFDLPALPVVADELQDEPMPAVEAPPQTGLEAFEVPKQVAATGPVVAEHIDLDPSLSEIPTRSAVLITPDLNLNVPGIENTAPPMATPPETPSPQPSPPRTLPDAAELPNQSSLKPSVPSDYPQTPPNASAGVWPYPTSLIAQLQAVATDEPQAAAWAQEAITLLERIAKLNQLAAPEVNGTLDQLHQLSLRAKEIAATLPTDNQRSRVLRAGYGIVRRIAIWQLVHAAAIDSSARQTAIPSTAEWAACLATLEQKLQSLPGGAPWTAYLRLAEAKQKFAAPGTPPAERRALARDILRRLNSTQFDPQQGDFADSAVFFDLTKHLKTWADEPADLTRLIQTIEDYERQDLSAESTALSEMYQQIRWSPDPRIAEIGDTVNMYYRNANIRVAISAALVNRLLPKEALQAEYVQDYIQGAYVEGTSQASTRLRLVLLPDRLRWRVGLEAQGEVASDTSSTKGPATFYQNGVSQYRVRKMLLVDRRGVKLFNSEAAVNANNNLVDYETQYDPIPILGSIARAIARNQYDSAQDAARVEVEGKIQGRATTRIDQAMAEQLRKGQQNFQTKLLEPMRKLQLEPAAVDLETTHERLIARYRIAGHDHLSAHTPRPQAPGDSLLSVQVHETALNNVLDRLNLAGRRIELRELYKEVTAIFNKNAPPPPDDLPEDVYVTFMDSDPVRIDCEDGRVRLTIRMALLEHGKSKWRNFTVRGYYAPSADQLEANLARDGVIELIGDRLRVADQISLRGIFSRVLSRNRTLSLVNKQIAMAPELRDQQVTQLVIHDGWIGVALGPKLPQRQALGHGKSPLPRKETSSR